jgi:hypothetical protein
VERLAEARRGGGELARAVQRGEGGFGDPHETASRVEAFEGEPEQDRVDPHELRERPAGVVVGEDFREQVAAEPGVLAVAVGGQREPGDPGAGEGGQRVGGAGVRWWGGGPGRAFGEVGQDGEVQGAFAGEVGVDRAAGEFGAFGDDVDLRFAEAAAGELVAGGGEHLGAVAFLGFRPAEPDHRPPCRGVTGQDTVTTEMIRTSDYNIWSGG